ncbi:hypothetical protein [Lentzea sp. NPDC092896]|uniref:hypothetical protein n=1 Tax=Lentzea sp. NPDC092896 TaxID=3364127 RepID=UPI003820983D
MSSLAASPVTATALPLRDAVSALKVADEVRDIYQRDKFRHWTGADRDGCSTRAEVLTRREGCSLPQRADPSRHRLTKGQMGRWHRLGSFTVATDDKSSVALSRRWSLI